MFEAFARGLPEGQAYGVVAGIDRVVDAIERWRRSPISSAPFQS